MICPVFNTSHMETINASDFKARCLAILDRVQATGERVVILKRGRPVAELLPASQTHAEYPQLELKDTVIVAGDIVEPAVSGRTLGKPRAHDGAARHAYPDLVAQRQQAALSGPQEVVASASAESPLLVSDISLWEVATLHSLGRIQLTIPLRAWLDKAVAPPLVRRLGISPAIAAELVTLPDSFSTRSSRPNPRGDRPGIRRDAVDAGSQNC